MNHNRAPCPLARHREEKPQPGKDAAPPHHPHVPGAPGAPDRSRPPSPPEGKGEKGGGEHGHAHDWERVGYCPDMICDGEIEFCIAAGCEAWRCDGACGREGYGLPVQVIPYAGFLGI